MEKLQTLLHQISEVVLVEKTEQDAKWKRGEYFNIFEVLGLSTKEVRLHSAFLAELLNPNGSHGLGDKMLKSFMESVVKPQVPTFLLDTGSTKVVVEYFIGAINDDASEGGRIDVLLQDKDNNTIIIENKIYAEDQPFQLLRYNNYASKTARLSPDKYIIFYLTLDGKLASEDSTGNANFAYYPISYKDEILQWLNICLGQSALYPSIRETISQYKLNLESILNVMSESTTNKIIDILTDNANIESALTITALGDEVKKTIRRRFIEKLEKDLSPLLSKYNLVYDKSDIDNMTALTRDYPSINIYRENKSLLSFSIELEGGEVYYGLCVSAEVNTNKLTMSEPIWQKPNEGWPHGWNYLPGELKYWGNNEALIDMALGSEISQTIYNELERAIMLHAFEDIDNLLNL